MIKKNGGDQKKREVNFLGAQTDQAAFGENDFQEHISKID